MGMRIRVLTFTQSTAPGTIFHDPVILIFGHDLVGAVLILVIPTDTAKSIFEVHVVLAHVCKGKKCKSMGGDAVKHTQG